VEGLVSLSKLSTQLAHGYLFVCLLLRQPVTPPGSDLGPPDTDTDDKTLPTHLITVNAN